MAPIRTSMYLDQENYWDSSVQIFSEDNSNQKSDEEEDKNRQEPSETNLFYDAWTYNKEYSGLCQNLGLTGAVDFNIIEEEDGK